MEFSGPRGILLSFAIYYAATQDWSEVSFYAQKNYRNCVHKATRYFRSPFVFGSVNRVAIPEITKTQRFAHYDFKAPFMLKGALGNSKALSWADKELAESPLANDTLVNVGYRRSAEDFRITFREFLRTYKGTDLLLMSLIPEYLRSDIRLPFPFSCPNVNQCIRSLNLRWIDQGNAKFSNHHVHHDDTLTLNCLIKGRKVFTTVDYVKYGHLINIDIEHQSGMNQMDLDVMSYPGVDQVPEFVIADMKPGDCVYLPKEWIHQVNNHGPVISMQMWLPRNCVENFAKTCGAGGKEGEDVGAKPTFADILPIFTDEDDIVNDELQRFREMLRRRAIAPTVRLDYAHFRTMSYGFQTFKHDVTASKNFALVDDDGDGVLSQQEILDAEDEVIRRLLEVFRFVMYGTVHKVTPTAQQLYA